MFKDSNITRLDAWSLFEEADAIPDAALPAFVGSSKLGVGLDAAGLQSLPDHLGKKYRCTVEPWHATQADLYILRDGMLSEHLWQDEIAYTHFDPQSPDIAHTMHRNYMPLGYLTQSFAYGGSTYAGDDIRQVVSLWRRQWSLQGAIVQTSYGFEREPTMYVNIEVFAPHGGETIYVRLDRTANTKATGPFVWTVQLAFETRHGLSIYDQAGALGYSAHTITARIDANSEHKPVEPYTVVYAVAAEGASVACDAGGITVTVDGPLEEATSTWLRIDMRRLAGDDRAGAPALAAELERQAASFGRADYAEARFAHLEDMEAFWAGVADVEVVDAPGDEFETRRRFMLHMSEYLLRCGNDFGMGGSAQFLLMHQNGWQAGNFHDHHYIVDGVARVGMFDAAVSHLHWLRKVMRPGGRVFPWIINYDGAAPIPAERDRAPMSDANRAMLAVRIYELAGAGRAEMLSEYVYPIVAAVADQAGEWFERVDDGFLLKGVETDVMGDVPQVNEIGSVIMFDTVLRKAIAYARSLDIDTDRRAKWQRLVDGIVYDQANGRYLAYRGAPAGTRTSPWFANGLYLGEAQEYLDIDVYRRTLDSEPQTTICNFAWLNSAAAASQLRLGRPDRAEQLMVDSLENRVHGPGYFEEMAPVGLYALPPFPTAHGAYVTTACEQIVLSDFWRPAIAIGTCLPTRLRSKRIRFQGMRAIRGITVSGRLEPRRLEVTLTPGGEPVDLPVTLAIPASVGSTFNVLLEAPAEYQVAGQTVTVQVALRDDPVVLVIEG